MSIRPEDLGDPSRFEELRQIRETKPTTSRLEALQSLQAEGNLSVTGDEIENRRLEIDAEKQAAGNHAADEHEPLQPTG